MRVFVDGHSVTLDPSKSIGKGGEADVYDVGGNVALKLFKQPDHPDFYGDPAKQETAVERIAQHQKKLRAFPHNLPDRVVAPINLVTNQSGSSILGYTMPFLKDTEVLLRYSTRSFREPGVPDADVISIFSDLHNTVAGLHRADAVVGDFNDLNVLVRGVQAHIIDADSFQYGRFLSRQFTARFVDPLLCDPDAKRLLLLGLHSPDSDWYAFNVMLFQSLLFVDPYGGVFEPKNPSQLISRDARPLHRITVFHPQVKYPKPARRYEVLPDAWLEHFHQVFEKDQRGVFPWKLLETIRWTKCTACGFIHARDVCTACAHVAPAALKEVTTVRGQVLVSRIFQTRGNILFASYQGGKLRWIYHENGEFKREDGSAIVKSPIDPQMRFRIWGERTVIAKGGLALTFAKGDSAPDKLTVDTYGQLPMFDANESARYWTSNGQLMRDGQHGPEHIGNVLSGQTLFWVGPRFGFGFYRAAQLNVAFVFDATRRGINDAVKLAPIRGQLIDSTCFFANDKCWFFTTTQEGGKTQNRCTIIRSDGSIEATTEASDGDGSWLGTIRGKCAVGNLMLAATDDGIVRLEPDQGGISVTKTFPDTEPFVDSSCHLFPGQDGLYVVSRGEIHRLKIS